MDKKRMLLALGILVAISGLVPTILLTYTADPAHPYTISHATLVSGDGTLIQALVYMPSGIAGNHPGIVVAHGFCGNKESMQPLSIELVKRGITVVSIDFRGHGSSDGDYLEKLNLSDVGALMLDVMSGVKYLQGLGNIDKIGLLGHSMGGMTALATAEMYPGLINATVSIGMISTTFNFSRISNLMVAIGQYDQIFNENNALDFVRTYTGNTSAEIGVQYGDFASRNATKAVIGPLSEHLGEVFEPTIVSESVRWFELAFFGTIRYSINETVPYLVLSIIIMLVGCTFIIMSLVMYIGKIVLKKPAKQVQVEVSPVFTVGKLSGFYLAGSVVGLALFFSLSSLFIATLPVVMGNSLYAMHVGRVIAVFIALAMFKVLYRKQVSVKTLYDEFIHMSTHNFRGSLIYGILTAVVASAVFTVAIDWSITVAVPTTREYGAIFSIAVLLFPVLLVKEFYLRFIQSRLKMASKVKEYFSIVGIGILLENAALVPVMLLYWGKDFLALATSVFIFFAVLQQFLITWVYMSSKRSILSSTIFSCIFLAWMMIIFYPFGLSAPII